MLIMHFLDQKKELSLICGRVLNFKFVPGLKQYSRIEYIIYYMGIKVDIK
jgi:hypothetical protein